MPRDRWVHGLVCDGGPEIHFVEHGSGEPVILLHGFPDYWYMWRHQIPLLANAGYRAIALDLRGYNCSEAPSEVRKYKSSALAGDVVRVMDTLGIENATIIGHDWGGVVAWHLAISYPNRVNKLVVINAPHPSAYLRALVTSTQALRSWYVFAFQVPWLPELLLKRSGMKALRRIWSRAAGRSGNVTPADIEKYARSFSKDGKVRGAVNYYRAALRSSLGRKGDARVSAPTLLIWGGRDKFLVPQLPEMTRRWVGRLQIRNLADFGHWPQLESPETVNAAILEFIADD